MNIIKSTGEQSCKGQEDGDASTGSERPLKKARFAWQVKGKYHLKNETDKSNKNTTIPSPEPSTSKPSSTGQSSSSIPGSEVKDYLIKHEYSNLDSVLDPANSMLLPRYSISTKQPQNPEHLSSYERKSNSMLRSNSCNNVKTVSMTDNAEDRCIAQWQASQIKKACLDNNLNNMFESWLADPLPAGEGDTRHLIEFAEFMNHLPGDNSIENEGILMAISAHGLQNAPSRSNNASNSQNVNTSSVQTFDILSPLRSLSPIVSDDSQQTDDQQYDTEETLPDTLQTWQCENQNANDAPFAYFSEPSQPPYDFYDDNHQNSNTDSLEMDSQCDFMNVAVLYAIESKGLTTSGTEYG